MSFRRWVSIFFFSGALATASYACAPGGGGGGGGGGRGDSGTGGDAERSQAACTDGFDNDGDGLGDCMDPDCAVWRECGGGGGGVDSGIPPIEGCVSDTSVAEPSFAPVDIIFAIDNSGSMSEEAMIVQDNIDDFAADIFASGINYRVVLITAPGFVNVPDPLGSDDTHLRRVNASVSSHDAFEVILDEYGTYSDFLRADAKTHVVVVTDDESDMREGNFRSQLESNLGHPFTFHAIASEDAEHDCNPFFCDPGCEGPFGDAADVGERYYSLAAMTGGTTFSICTADWSPLWTTLQMSIVISATLPCFYNLPDPPAGEALNFESVNVVYTPSGGGADISFPRATTSGDCGGAAGWYYDDNSAPSQINLCPGACSMVEVDTSGAVTIQLGCEQILL